MTLYMCPVCGYDRMNEPPENHVICPSCGTHFDYHDVGVSHEELRDLWLAEGAQWFSPVRQQPPRWDPFVQLVRAGLLSDVNSSHQTESATTSNVGSATFTVLLPAHVSRFRLIQRSESARPVQQNSANIIDREVEFTH